jgi:uncharacterized membrane protein
LHLIHPALVHFSIAFIVAGGLAEAYGIFRSHEPVQRWGATLLLIGLVSLVPTIASGYLADNTLDVSGAPKPLLDAHERNGWLLLGMLFATQFWKGWRGGKLGEAESWLYAGVLLVVVGLTGWSAWLGGTMVYGYGVGVLR